MTQTVYRMQDSGIKFDKMLDFNSSNWTTGKKLCGLAACLYPDDLIDLANHWYHGDYDGQEVVEFTARILEDIGDGFLVEPISEVSRMSLDDFCEINN